MLYPIPKKDTNLFESCPGLRLIKEFSKLENATYNDKKMRFVMLVADYQSPLKQHPEQRRRELAALEAGYIIQGNTNKTIDARGKVLVDGKDKLVEAAIVKYREIQRNEDLELLELYTKQLDDIKKAIATPTTDPDDLKKRNTLLESLPNLKRAKNDLSRLVDMAPTEVVEDENSKPLSLIDRIDD